VVQSEQKSPSEGRGQKAASRIATYFRRAIVTGNLRPGDRLLSERELGEQFSVSRPTLREAMRLLETESLIEISRGQHGGAKVKSLDVSVTARQVGMFLQHEGTTLADVYQARAFLEPPAAGLLAAAPQRQVMDQLRQNVVEAKRALEQDDANALAEALSDFSEILIDKAGNNTLSLMCRLLRDIVRRQQKHLTVSTYSRKGVEKMHWLNIRAREKVIELIESGKSEEAERFWRLHLVESAKVSLSAYHANMPINVLEDAEPELSPTTVR